MNNGLKREIDIYLQEIASYSLLSSAQEKELGRIIRNGNGQVKKKAIKELAEANLRLVVYIIMRHYLSYLNGKTTFFDLIQAGNEGLLKAAKRYDPIKYNNKFSTYAGWKIRQEIPLAIERQKEFPVSNVNTRTQLNQIKGIMHKYLKENGCWPTAEWIAGKKGIPVKKVNQLLKIPQTIISLEDPIGNDGDSFINDFIPDENCLNPEEIALKKEFEVRLPKQTDKVLKSLSPREEVVLRKCFIIGEKRKHTLDEIGKGFQVTVTKERVRVIREDALRKVRNHYKKKELLEEFIQ